MLFEFQTQVARLLGTDVANASMYDGSTACWEAIAMARRVTRRGKAILSGGAPSALCQPSQKDDGALHRRPARHRDPRSHPRSARRRHGAPARRDRRRDELRRRPDTPASSAISPTCLRAGCRLPCEQGAADRCRHRAGGAGRSHLTGRDGCRYRRRRGAVDRRLGRATCRRPLMSGCSAARRNISARCRGDCAARRSMPMAGAASC